MKQKVNLSRALLRLSPPVPPELHARVRRSLALLAAQKEEKIVKNKVSLGLVLVIVLVLLLTGAAVALTQLGIWDIVKDYGETPLPKAQSMVQTDFGESTFALGEASVTLREAVSDGLMGSLVVEYRVPEGSYLYAPDSMQKGEKTVYGETATMEEIFQKYGVFYYAMDEGMDMLVDGQVQPLSSDVGFEQVKTADNVLVVNISFSLQGIDPEALVYSPGLFKMESADFDKRQKLAVEIPLKLQMNADKTQKITPVLGDAAKAAGIKAMTVISTPLTLAVTVQLETAQPEGLDAYTFEVQMAPGEELSTSFLSSFVWAEDPENNSYTRGYAPVAQLPDTLYLQMKGYDNQTGVEKLLGEPVEVKLK